MFAMRDKGTVHTEIRKAFRMRSIKDVLDVDVTHAGRLRSGVPSFQGSRAS
jgi:hypothetical protein